MSYSEKFVIMNDLKPGDAILLKKKLLGMLNHFAVYLGRDRESNKPVFAANYTKGVEILHEVDVDSFLQKLVPEKIDRFWGSNLQRKNAVQRAISLVGKTNYNLIFNNCEHYKNFVQTGVKYSSQVENAGTALLTAGGITVLAGALSKSDKATGIGLLGLALGAIVLGGAIRD